MSPKTLQNTPQSRQRGYGLVEVMISLVIIAILIAVAVALSINLRTSTSITANTNHLTQIAANAKKTFGVINQYTAVNDVRAVRTVVPRELRTYNPVSGQYDDTAFNNFGGEIKFGISNLTQNGDTMVVVWQNVPKDQCEQIVTQVAGLMRRIEVERAAAGAVLAAPATTHLTQAAALGSAAPSVTQVTPGTVTGGTLGAAGTLLVKGNDLELSTAALNDACNGGSESVRLWFWVGRS
ncbi:MAG: prepilin-type N-terminal cleavage/methylation domain-containing protein [Alphaproteobacteria bacterium]|nr:prepilin-type N-terminal cleavage/methylation domain-containing protein [Alphaproteobacteria bacterium]